MSCETNNVRRILNVPADYFEPLSCGSTSIGVKINPLHPTCFTGKDVTHHQPLCQVDTRVVTGPSTNDPGYRQRPHRSFQLDLPASEASVTGDLSFDHEEGLGWYHDLKPRWMTGTASSFVAKDGTLLADVPRSHSCYVQDRLILNPGLASILEAVSDLDGKDLGAPECGKSEATIDAEAFEKARYEHEQNLSHTVATQSHCRPADGQSQISAKPTRATDRHLWRSGQMLKFAFAPGPGFFSRKVPDLDQTYNLTRDSDFFVAAHPEQPSGDYARTPITTQASIALPASAVQQAYGNRDVSQLRNLKVYQREVKYPAKVTPLPGDDTIRYLTYDPAAKRFGYSEKMCQYICGLSLKDNQGALAADVWLDWTVDPREFGTLEQQAEAGKEPVLRQRELRWT